MARPSKPRTSARPAPPDAPAHRCRLCGTNDRDALVEHLAEQLWESRRHGTLDDWPWAEAGGYWRDTFRSLAETAVAALGR